MSERTPKREQDSVEQISRRKKRGRQVVAAALMWAVSQVPAVQTESNYTNEPASITVIHDKTDTDPKPNKCQPKDEFFILHTNGVGMKITESSANEAKEIIGKQFDECMGYFDYGSDYDTLSNVEAFEAFEAENDLEYGIIFAHSFGGVASIDMLNAYYDRNPDSKLKMTVVFFSSPGGSESLSTITRMFAEVHARARLPEPVIYAETLVGSIVQGGNSATDPKTYEDALINTKKNPPKLLYQTTRDLLDKGMARWRHSPDKLQLIYAGSPDDGAVVNDRAPVDISRRVGLPIEKIITLNCIDDFLGCHADMWWSGFRNEYRNAINDSVLESSKKYGFTVRSKVPVNDQRSIGRSKYILAA